MRTRSLSRSPAWEQALPRPIHTSVKSFLITVIRESELRFNRSTHLRYLHVQISWGKLGVICVIKNIYNLQEFVFYKRHIFLLFSFFSVHNVSLNGAWRGFVPEGGGGETWGILGWGCTAGTLSLYQTNFQFFLTYHLPFYYSFIWLPVSFSVWF